MLKVIYGSTYGHSKRYADYFANIFNIKAKSFGEVRKIGEDDIVVYFGGLYAGGIKGLSSISPNFNELVLVTVGLANPKDKTNVEKIKKSVKNRFKKFDPTRVKIFHLRGGIDYDKLAMHHRLMMRLVYMKAKNIKKEDQDEETKTMIDTYGSKVDFVDFNSLKPVIDYIKERVNF